MKKKSAILVKLAGALDAMSEAELLACVLSRNPGAAALKAAEKLLISGGSLLADGQTRYSPRLKAAKELGKRLAGKSSQIYLKPGDIWTALTDIRASKKEHFVTFYLDTRNQEIKRDIVSIGTLNYNLVHPREVFEPAVRNLAASIILAHNHPSGCLEPSDEDLSLTKRLVSPGKLLGIEVIDHIIVTKDGFISFKQKNLL